jgi:hypothetical protein
VVCRFCVRKSITTFRPRPIVSSEHNRRRHNIQGERRRRRRRRRRRKRGRSRKDQILQSPVHRGTPTESQHTDSLLACHKRIQDILPLNPKLDTLVTKRIPTHQSHSNMRDRLHHKMLHKRMNEGPHSTATPVEDKTTGKQAVSAQSTKLLRGQ